MSSAVFIFIPAFNCEQYIGEAIESVLNQTYQNWKLLVIDDCSHDKTFEIANNYALGDGRITTLRNEQNLGMLANWNKGISFCKDEFFIKLDGDDRWHPQMLEKSLEIMNSHPSVGLMFTKYINIDDHGQFINGTEISLPAFAKKKPFSCLPLVEMGEDKMLSFSILRQGLSLMRRIIFDRVGVYRQLLSPETQAATDTEYYFRVGCHFDIFCLDQTLYHYRVHDNSISQTDIQNHRAAKKIFEIKYVILDYYFSQGKISKQFWKENKTKIVLAYRIHLSAYYRNRRMYIASLFELLKSLLLSPGRVIKFYINRLNVRNGEA